MSDDVEVRDVRWRCDAKFNVRLAFHAATVKASVE